MSSTETHSQRGSDNPTGHVSATFSGYSRDYCPIFSRPFPFAVVLLVTGLVGFLGSFFLFIERIDLYKNPTLSLSCDVSSVISCGSTMQTWQAELLGFPNPILGIIYFPVVLCVAASLLAKAQFERWFWWLVQGGATASVAFVIWFWSQALYAIGVLCPYCMIVWAAVIPLFIATTTRNMVHGVIPAPAGLTRFLGSWMWTIVFLIYIAIATSILLRFGSTLFQG